MIIVFVGSIGSGKSTGADILKRKFNFEEITFAQPIKDFALLLGFENKNVYGSQQEKVEINPEFGVSGRQFMQTFGTDIMRNASLFPNIQNIWIKVVEIKIKKALSQNKNLVISDCRFQDESEMLRKYNPIFIKLKRNCDFYSDHFSEKELNNIENSIIYNNNDSLKDLEFFLEKIVNTKYDFYSFLKTAYHE